MIETPRLVDAPMQLVAVVHIQTPRSKMPQVMGPGIGEVMANSRRSGCVALDIIKPSALARCGAEA